MLQTCKSNRTVNSLFQVCLTITEPFSPFYLEEMKVLSFSRTVNQLIMRVRKPKVEYKLALQLDPREHLENSQRNQALFFKIVSLLNFLIPSSTIVIFSLYFFYSLHHNFNIFPQFHYFPPQFFLFPFSTILLFSLLNVFIPSSTMLLFNF